MPHELAIATRCNYCARKFYGPRGPIVIGERPQARFTSFVAQLGRHITEAHPDIFEQMLALNWEFQGFNLMRHFNTDDPAVKQNEDVFRWKLHQSTLQCRAQKLEERADLAAMDVINCLEPTEDAEQIAQRDALRILVRQKTHAALEELRQLLEEPDRYVVLKQPEDDPKPESVVQ